MDINLIINTGQSVDRCLDTMRRVEEAGLAGVAIPNAFGLDALMLTALGGRETARIALQTAVVPTFPRHPHALAQQALTAQAACGGRLVLGIGISHQVVIQGMMGLPYERLVRHLREYLEVLTPLLRGEEAGVSGELYTVNAPLRVRDVAPPPVLIGALRPQMVRLAGRMTDGTVTWMANADYIERAIVKPITAAAQEAGRPAPQIIAGVAVCITDDVAGATEKIGKDLAMYGTLPAYRAVLDDQGSAGPADVALIGSEQDVETALRRFTDAGATALNASIIPFGDDRQAAYARTFDFLSGVAGTS